jgi:hypothetical protein
VFIAGRDAQAVLADDVQAPGHPLLKFLRIKVDKEKQTVSARLLGLFGNGLAGTAPAPAAPWCPMARSNRHAATSSRRSLSNRAPSTHRGRKVTKPIYRWYHWRPCNSPS